MFVLTCFAAVAAVPVASAQVYQGMVELGSNLGQLDFTIRQSSSIAACGNKNFYRTVSAFTSFVYAPVTGANQSIPGSTNYTSFPSQDTCNHSQAGPTLTYNGPGYSFTIVPTGLGSVKATILVPGYINPKYIVVGVIYAPPGGVVSGGVAKGNVSYTHSNLVSSTVTTKSSLGSSYTQSTVVAYPGGSFNIQGWASGSVSGSQSTSFTESTTTTDSTGVTVQKATGTTLAINGPTCPY